MRKSFGDMVRSLGLMAVIIAALLFIGARYLIMPGSAERPPAADYTSVVQDFPRESGAAALAPTSLPVSWRANAARLTAPSPGATSCTSAGRCPAAATPASTRRPVRRPR